jgi:hypothetical protein
MQLDEIRSLRDARPFRPFMLTLNDGREFLIESGRYLGITPRGVVLAVTRDRGTAWFAPDQVKEARVMRMVAS